MENRSFEVYGAKRKILVKNIGSKASNYKLAFCQQLIITF